MEDRQNQKNLILQMLEAIAVCELDQENMEVGDAGYINQRSLISSLFTKEYNKGQIMLRLTVIDSLYSTNAAYSYFSFEEMAEKIYSLGDGLDSEEERHEAAKEYFYKIAKGGSDDKNLFSEPYGYQKNLSEGSKQMSLLSKYAYYDLLKEPQKYPLGFPIYDRLAKEAYPLVRKMLGEKDFYSMPQLETPTIEQYVTCLTQLRKAIFENNELFKTNGATSGYQQFDILDAYLWRMGKFTDGNMSLLMGRDDYEKFIENIGLDAPFDKENPLIRKENEEYRKRVRSEFLVLHPHKKEKDFDFNLLVLKHLEEDNAPFKELQEEKYLMALLNHWKVFISYKDKAPKRGVKFNSNKE